MRLALFIFLLSTTSVHANDEEHQGILATLYVQNSAEFDANSINVYKSAIDKLPKLLATKNISAAIENYEKALKANSGLPAIHLSLGMIYYQFMNHTPKALGYLKESLRLNPGQQGVARLKSLIVELENKQPI